MTQTLRHSQKAQHDWKEKWKLHLLTLSSSTDACVSSSAQALVSIATSDPDKEAALPSQVTNTFIPFCRGKESKREIVLATYSLPVCEPCQCLLVHTLQKVSRLSKAQASTLASSHWPPAPHILDAKASLVSSGKASQGHWRLAISMWSACGQWKVMLSDPIICSTERQGWAEGGEWEGNSTTMRNQSVLTWETNLSWHERPICLDMRDQSVLDIIANCTCQHCKTMFC